MLSFFFLFLFFPSPFRALKLTSTLHSLFGPSASLVRDDDYKCKSLFHSGSWGTSSNTNRPFLQWIPNDGTVHEYTRDDTVSCLRGRRIVFVGDSWIRQLFWAASTHLDHFKQEVATLDFHLSSEKERNLALEAEGVRLEFIWDPWLNSTNLARELARFTPVAENDEKRHPNAAIDAPALLVVGTPGMWAMRHGGAESMNTFRAGVDSLLPFLKSDLDPYANGMYGAQHQPFEAIPNQLIVVPVPIPYYKRLTPARKQTMTPEKVVAMNDYLAKLPSSVQSHIPWVFTHMIDGQPDAYNVNGIHVTKDVREKAFNLLINARCNAGLSPRVEGVRSLACRAAESSTLIQSVIVLVGIVATPLAWFKSRGETPAVASIYGAVAPLSLAALLCWMTEKTTIFTKNLRDWDPAQFAFQIVAFAAISFITLTNRQDTGRPTSKAPPAIPREYSDELKGLLQVVIIWCGQYDAVSNLGVFKLFRIAIAAYIFLSAYGHTTYLLSTSDYSFHRIATVLLRFNLLSCVLVFTTSAPWTTYHFTAVVSFWFLVTYAVLAVHKPANGNIPALFLKLIASAIVVNLVILRSGLVETLVNIANAILRSSWDGGKLSRELAVDSITPFIAILSAALTHRAAQLRTHEAPVPSDLKPSLLSEFLDDVISAIAGHESPRFGAGQLAKSIFTAFAALILAIMAFVFSNVVIRYHDTAELCHPLLSWIPIVAAVYLRGTCQGPYLAFPAFLGKIALEVYLLQNHLWLVGGGTDILRLWPRRTDPSILYLGIYYVQRIFITIAFLWIAAKCHDATRAAVDLIVGGDAAEQQDLEALDADLLESKGAEVKLLKAQIQDHDLNVNQWAQDPKWRFGVFLGVLWVANLLYDL